MTMHEADESPTNDVFVVRTPTRRVDVTGTDRVRYLEDVTSQHLEDAGVGDHRGALHLDVHGGVVAMFDVVVLGDRLALVVDDGDVAELVVEQLGSRTFLMDARFEATEDRAIAVRGGRTDGLLAEGGLAHVAGRARLADDILIVPRPGGADLLAPAPTIDAVAERLEACGARRGTDDDLVQWRVDEGVPAAGSEVVAPHLPEEAGLLPTHVHLAKGCYPGQEAVARMWVLGRPRRRLAIVDVRDGEVTAGWEAGDGRQRVSITTVGPRSSRALAYVPADSAAGDVLELGDVRIEVLGIVGDDPNPPGSDPRVTRGRDRRRAVSR